MKKTALLVVIAIVAALAGCESTGPKTKTGAVAGGVIGAAGGAIIGHQSGHGLEGAGIGAAVGAISGALLGSAWDQKDKQARATNPNHIPLTQIAQMALQGTPDAVIISEIQRTHSVYQLNSEIITYLKQNKVGDRAIDYMMQTAQ